MVFRLLMYLFFIVSTALIGRLFVKREQVVKRLLSQVESLQKDVMVQRNIATCLRDRHNKLLAEKNKLQKKYQNLKQKYDDLHK